MGSLAAQTSLGPVPPAPAFRQVFRATEMHTAMLLKRADFRRVYAFLTPLIEPLFPYSALVFGHGGLIRRPKAPMQRMSPINRAGRDTGTTARQSRWLALSLARWPARLRAPWLVSLRAVLFLTPPALVSGWLLLFSDAPWSERVGLSALLLACLLAGACVSYIARSRSRAPATAASLADSAFARAIAPDAGAPAPDAVNTGGADTASSAAARSAAADAEDRMRQRTEAFAKASHELRTPLNAIIGYSELIQRTESAGTQNPAKRMDYVRNIEMAGRHMLDVVTGVLDFSQLEAGAYSLTITDIELGDTCSAALRLVNHGAGEKGIALWCEVPPDLPKIQADKRAVMQMLLNLLGNAVKFSSEGDAVTVRAWQDGEMVRIAVSDTGPGIPKDEIVGIKQSFRRASNTRGTTVGHGLGLAVTANLVELHGGSLSAANAFGGGAEFVITLPIQQQDNQEEEMIQAVA